MGVGERFRKRFFFKGLTKLALKSNGGGILELDAILVLLLHGREGRLELFKCPVSSSFKSELFTTAHDQLLEEVEAWQEGLWESPEASVLRAAPLWTTGELQGLGSLSVGTVRLRAGELFSLDPQEPVPPASLLHAISPWFPGKWAVWWVFGDLIGPLGYIDSSLNCLQAAPPFPCPAGYTR